MILSNYIPHVIAFYHCRLQEPNDPTPEKNKAIQTAAEDQQTVQVSSIYFVTHPLKLIHSHSPRAHRFLAWK